MAVVAGAGGSLAFMLRVGHRNQSRTLLVLFGIWVLSPFVALGLAGVLSRRWSARVQPILVCATLVLALGSLAIYGTVALGPPRAKPAGVFLIVPLSSWLLIAVIISVAFLSGRQSRQNTGGR